ncbi:MAG: hypothetical protein LiPW15_50 [Parcubacteria group bacterium LiPW_15]|nr:MAG: hypothetical protein LiPW15_50 [Parcubacteria group bacterium LiPW_15]
MFGAVGLVLIAAILVVVLTGKKSEPEIVTPGGATATTTNQSNTYKPVSVDTKVPGINSQVDSGVAKPTEVKAVGVNDLSARSFNVVLNGDKVSPEKVIIKLFDIITINFSAVDKTYDFVQPDNGLSWTVPKGGSKSLQFQGTTAGQFTFYCVSCGGPSKGPIGYFVVVPK